MLEYKIFIYTLAIVGAFTIAGFIFALLAELRVRAERKRQDKKNRSRIITILLIAGILAGLTGCGALKEIYRIDKIKQDNCNYCEEKNK